MGIATESAFAGAGALAAAVSSKRVGCLELLDFFLERVDRFNPALNAIVAFQIEKARERAREADHSLAKGEIWGPLHGLPMTVKESFDIAGLPTTFGNPAFAGNIAQTNAAVVDRLERAGAIVFGKTNVPFMLIDSQSFNEIYGTTNNPWDLTRSPGGSSGGGAAALAAGLVALEAGSDIGGSLRNPAHYSGVYGHKPSFGIVSTRGHAPPGTKTPMDMSVVGPLARNAGDLALALDVLNGPDDLAAAAWRVVIPEPRVARLRDCRVAVWPSSPLSAVDDAVMKPFHAAVDAIERAGARVQREVKPAFDVHEEHRLYMTLLRAATSSRMPDHVFEEQKRIAAAVSPDDRSHRAATARGATLAHRDWLAANEGRTRLRLAWRAFFEDFDVLLTPVAATPAFEHDHNPDRDERKMRVNGGLVAYTDQLFWAGLAAASYLPATAAPIGFAGHLPVGLQILGPEGGDRTTIAFAGLLAQEIGGFLPPPGYDA